MKFWNKQKAVRLCCWTKVVYPHSTSMHAYYTMNAYQGWWNRADFAAVKQKFQLNPSKGKFYMSILSREIWFELGADATMFILTQN